MQNSSRFKKNFEARNSGRFLEKPYAFPIDSTNRLGSKIYDTKGRLGG